MDLIIKNGTIVTATDMYSADIAVKDGKISEIGENLSGDGVEVVDASGKLVLPGAIDVHTHLAMPFGGTVSADGYLELELQHVAVLLQFLTIQCKEKEAAL